MLDQDSKGSSRGLVSGALLGRGETEGGFAGFFFLTLNILNGKDNNNNDDDTVK